MKYLFLMFPVLLNAFMLHAQTDSRANYSIFQTLSKSLKEFSPDTTSLPNDKITRKIIQLRELRGGFNINEAIAFKLEEDREKNEIPKAEFEKFAAYMQLGDGRRLLDNAVNHIYRQSFTYKELKQIARFYQRPGGKKMAEVFPAVMLKSLAAGEMIKTLYENNRK